MWSFLSLVVLWRNDFKRGSQFCFRRRSTHWCHHAIFLNYRCNNEFNKNNVPRNIAIWLQMQWRLLSHCSANTQGCKQITKEIHSMFLRFNGYTQHLLVFMETSHSTFLNYSVCPLHSPFLILKKNNESICCYEVFYNLLANFMNYVFSVFEGLV